MPNTKKTRKKSKTNSWSASRLVKTGGHFSAGKLLILVVSFVAIGAVIVNASFAATQYTYNVFAPGASSWGGYNYNFNGEVGIAFPTFSANGNGFNWESPQFGVNAPAPSGTKLQVCMGMAAVFGGSSSTVQIGYTDHTHPSTHWAGLTVSGGRGYCATLPIGPGYHAVSAVMVNLSGAQVWLGWAKVTVY